MYTVANPDPNSRGRGQLPNPNEWNSALTSATKGEMLTPNPNEWNSTLTSETKNIYPYLYIDLGKWVAGYELSMRVNAVFALQRADY